MSDEKLTDEADESEVEGHGFRLGANDESSEDGDDEVEAHAMRTGAPRVNAPRVD